MRKKLHAVEADQAAEEEGDTLLKELSERREAYDTAVRIRRQLCACAVAGGFGAGVDEVDKACKKYEATLAQIQRLAASLNPDSDLKYTIHTRVLGITGEDAIPMKKRGVTPTSTRRKK